MITIKQKGSFNHTERYLSRLKTAQLFATLNKYGDIGVAALSSATPKDSGVTSGSWGYRIVQRKGYYSIRWYNTHDVDGTPLVVLLQYGHGTKNGGYVQGRDYIMPAMRPVFDQIAAEAWREVAKI